MKYRGSYIFDIAEVVYYLLAYHSWAIFSLGFFLVTEKYSQRFSTTILVIVWNITAVLWLSVFLSLDTWLNMSLVSSTNRTWLEVLGNIPNAAIFFYFILYCVTTAACIAVYYYRSSQKALIDALTMERKHADSELKLAEKQLEQLQSQLSPHFLFNCLSSISALARSENKDTLISSIAQMGNLLRFCVSSSTERFIPLAQELEFVDDYVALQTMRYPDLFRFEKEVSDYDRIILCPPFLLQPLIENTFTHGVDTNQEVTHIQLDVKVAEDNIIVTITNTKSENTEQNIGLSSAIKNFKERLHILYPSKYLLDLENNATRFIVSLRIPALTREDIDVD